jgi:hypothetical protein
LIHVKTEIFPVPNLVKGPVGEVEYHTSIVILVSTISDPDQAIAIVCVSKLIVGCKKMIVGGIFCIVSNHVIFLALPIESFNVIDRGYD